MENNLLEERQICFVPCFERGVMKRITALLLALLAVVLLVGCRASDAPTLRLYFLDVGQGDSILVRTAQGDVLIDAGTEESQVTLCLRLEQLGVTELTLAVFTHADSDHMGGADGVVESFSVKEIWLSDTLDASESALRLAETLKETDTEVNRVQGGTVKQMGDALISVLYPLAENVADGNENSIVLKLHYGEIDVLLTGDAGVEQEQTILDTYGASQLACDLYKVGHHGSNTSSSREFLEAIRPRYAVISCGAANSYGHPTGEVLARLEGVGAEVLRTDLEGEIVFETDGIELSYRK